MMMSTLRIYNLQPQHRGLGAILTAPAELYVHKNRAKQKSRMTPQHDRHQDVMKNYKLFFGDNSPSDHGDGVSVSAGASCHIGHL